MRSEIKSKAERLAQAFDAETFRRQGHQVIDILADYLNKAGSKQINQVLPPVYPDEMLEKWSDEFPENQTTSLSKVPEMLKKLLAHSNHLHHPHYVGHQVSSPVPTAALWDMVSSFLNNGTAVYEMGPSSTIMEKHLISWMSGLIGFDRKADGFFTSGGTLGNLTALLAARQAKAGYDICIEGVKSEQPFAVLVSEQAHYSIKRAVQIMGLGSDSVFLVPSNENYSLDVNSLEKIYERAISSGRKVLAVVGNACCTATGSYDDLEYIGNFCQKHDIWFHVDGAHGASALVSEKYRHLLKGIEKADSVIWDAHKMMLMPALITAVIFKNGDLSYETFSQKASYLFEKDAREEWYNLGQRTMECTKTMMSLKLYASLVMYGTGFFSDYITRMYDLTGKFARIIRESSDFDLAVEPQSNIICFRYKPEDKTGNLNDLQLKIRKNILSTGAFYIVNTTLRGNVYLRCTIINPLTQEDDLKNLLFLIREVI